MKPIHIRRLRKLIDFLRKLPPKKFLFGDVGKCGAVACAIGWTPRVFPKLVTKQPTLNNYEIIAARLFGVSPYTASDLFTPESQRRVDSRLPKCGTRATPKQVAAMLEKFIKLQTGK